MPVIDANAGLDPIQVVIDAETYTVIQLSEAKLNEISDFGKDDDTRTLTSQLGMLLDVEPSVFAETDIRVMANAIKGIMGQITDGLPGDVKND